MAIEKYCSIGGAVIINIGGFVLQKQIIVFMLALALVFTTSLSAMAAEKEITVYLDGQQISLTKAPIIKNDNILVPFRDIFEAIGLEVAWDRNTNIVTGTKEEKTIHLLVGAKTALVDGRTTTLNVAPMIVGDATMVPLRFVAETTGLKLEWDNDERRVLITSEDDIITATATVLAQVSAITPDEALAIYDAVLIRFVEDFEDILPRMEQVLAEMETVNTDQELALWRESFAAFKNDMKDITEELAAIARFAPPEHKAAHAKLAEAFRATSDAFEYFDQAITACLVEDFDTMDSALDNALASSELAERLFFEFETMP